MWRAKEAMNRHRTSTLIFTVVLLNVFAPAAAAEEPMTVARKSFETLLSLRDRLLLSLQKRQAEDATEGSAGNYHLTFDEGADRDTMNVVLRRSGGRWATAYAEVPAWRQGTMQEWRGFHLSNGAGCAWRPNLRFPVAAAGLTVRDGCLSGSATVTFKLDQTLDEKLPPGEPVSWWDRFIPSGHAVPRKQDFTIHAAVEEDVYLLELVLEGGVRWRSPPDRKRRQPAAVTVRPVFLRVQVPSTRFTTARASTPTWNGGYHEADATGLRLENGRLTGKLVVLLHQDGWVPWRGGKSRMVPPVTVHYELDARLGHNEVHGSFLARGVKETIEVRRIVKGASGLSKFVYDMGSFKGVVRGRGGRAVIGRFSADGEMGAHAGAVTGMLLDDPEPLRRQIPASAPLSTDDTAAVKQIAAQINTVLNHIRGLHLAIHAYPFPLDEARAQTDTAAPVWPEEGSPDRVLLAAYCAQALSLVTDATGEESATLPEVRPEGNGASPSSGVVPLEIDGDGNLLPEHARDWYYMTQWQIMGPFEQRVGIEHNAGRVPDVVPMHGLHYRQTTDRFGARRSDAPARRWQKHTTSSPRLGPPWEKAGFYNRFNGEVWYASGVLISGKRRRVWMSLEACEHAKLWVNGRLAWVGGEKTWRYRSRGRMVVSVYLERGPNQLLVRGHRDRRPSWVRFALTCREPFDHEPRITQEITRYAGPYVFPDATPPLVWDIDTGVNVVWRKADLAGSTRPLVVGDAIVVSSDPDTLYCVDAVTGEIRWSRRSTTSELPLLKERRASDPLSDGKTVWVHAPTGVAACYSLNGNRRWIRKTHLIRTALHRYCDMLIIEGDIAPSWPVPQEITKPRAGKKRPGLLGVLVVDAATGNEVGRWTLAGSVDPGISRVLCGGSGEGEAAVLLTSAGVLIDLRNLRLLSPLDVEYPGAVPAGGQIVGTRRGRPFAMCSNADTLFMTTMEENVAIHFRLASDGRFACSHRWESNYEHSGFGSWVAPSVATERYLFTWIPVLDRGPHCPDARLELHVQDARTGRPLGRLKPALDHAVNHYVTPVVAGDYVFCGDIGGGSHGGLSTHGQIAIATADGYVRPVARNLVALGTRASPVFRGDCMYLRSPKALTCIAVTTDEGRRHQNRVLAKTLLAAIGSPPTAAAPRAIKPMNIERRTLGRGVPVGKMVDGRATEYWLGAGPIEVDLDEADLASLRPITGTVISSGGKDVTFGPLSREFAFNDPPIFERQFVLQGTGDIVPFFSTRVDPRCVSGLVTGTGLLYTVLDNPRDRIVLVPTLGKRGVTQWLCGTRIRAREPLRLGPGLYPYLIRIEPQYYMTESQEVLPPIDVVAALEKGALKKVGWPQTWHVFGPLPPDGTTLMPDQLRALPERIVCGEHQYDPFPILAEGNTLYLTSLIGLRPGQKPDVAGAPREVRIGLSSRAYCFGVIRCPADGILYITMGADWFCRWYLDGTVVYDTFEGGNAAAPTDVKAHPFAVRVAAGDHVLAVEIKPGSKGWSVSSLGGFSNAAEDVAPFRVASRIKKADPDFHVAPAFKEIPHPPTRYRRWIKKVKRCRGELEAVVRNMPGTEEAKAAAAFLARITRTSSAAAARKARCRCRTGEFDTQPVAQHAPGRIHPSPLPRTLRTPSSRRFTNSPGSGAVREQLHISPEG